MTQKKSVLIITCEHASNALPAGSSLSISPDLLQSHRGYDIGAFQVYKALVKEFHPDFCSAGKFTRLYVDLNRNLRNNKNASPKAIAYYQKYRSAVEQFVAENISRDVQILHLAIHSFTSELNGVIRNADVGILYDPSRPAEREYASIIIDEIHRAGPRLKVRKNYPYLGKTDGLCTPLRNKYDPQKTGRYVGFEIEINQKLLQRFR